MFLQPPNINGRRIVVTTVSVLIPGGLVMDLDLRLSVFYGEGNPDHLLKTAQRSLQAAVREKYDVLCNLEQVFWSGDHIAVQQSTFAIKQNRAAQHRMLASLIHSPGGSSEATESRETGDQPVFPITQQLYARSIGGSRGGKHRLTGVNAGLCAEEVGFLDHGVRLGTTMHFHMRQHVPSFPHLGVNAYYSCATDTVRSVLLRKAIVIPVGMDDETLQQLLQDSLKGCLLEDINEEPMNDVE